MNNFSYFLKEGIANLFTNRMVTFMTILTVIVSLLVTGVFQVISTNLVHISGELGNNFEFNIFIKDSVEEDDLEDVAQKLMSIAMVKDAVLKSKSETFREFKEKIGNDSLLQGITEEDNPFRNCYIVTLTSLENADYVLEEITLLDEVDSVSNNLETSKKLATVEKKVNLYSIIYGNFNQVLEGIYLLGPGVVFSELLITNLIYGILIGGLGASFAVSKHLKV